MKQLPEIHVLYPQKEPAVWSKCIYCSTEIFEKEEYVEANGYHYCDETCFAKLAIEEGNADRRIAGE